MTGSFRPLGLPIGLLSIDRFTPADTEQASRMGYEVVVSDLAGVTNKSDLMEAIADDFDFGPTFGRNWDALEEALGDWATARSPQLWVCYHLDHLARSQASTAKSFVDIAGEALIVAGSQATGLLVGYTPS